MIKQTQSNSLWEYVNSGHWSNFYNILAIFDRKNRTEISYLSCLTSCPTKTTKLKAMITLNQYLLVMQFCESLPFSTILLRLHVKDFTKWNLYQIGGWSKIDISTAMNRKPSCFHSYALRHFFRNFKRLCYFSLRLWTRDQ